MRTAKGARLARAPKDGAFPPGFYATTNHPTEVHVGRAWLPVAKLKMDAGVVVSANRRHAGCRTMAEVREGDLVVVGDAGVRVAAAARNGGRANGEAFAFMASAVSSERPVESAVRGIAADIREAKRRGGKVCVVAGPAVVHTGASDALAAMIRGGVVDVLFGGNALAAHDLERQMYGTSLGTDLHGRVVPRGHRHHLQAINEARAAGSIAALIRSGRVRGGIMFEAHRRGIPVVLAGSIRDDGPLPEVVTDVMEAQRRMRAELEGVRVVLMLATLLHSVAVGNLLGSHVRTVCVDINPATVTKLADRGTAHAAGVVTDVGTFLPRLAEAARRLSRRG
jgi:lysine-ketoglutarate reductase/saccharopine dehydrogenase-like protein (TIGR00300 family)